jgi:trans-2,3-dihydro-3-hydroxyanthranilate isomerase
MRFFITDVFCEEKYSGNQLATYIVDSPLTDREMQRIAHEIHFAESTFILSETPGNNGYRVRIFSPEEELDFAGHPALGTAFIIRDRLIKHPVDTVTLDLKVGPIPVSFSGDGAMWMDQVSPEFRDIPESEILLKMLDLPMDALHADLPIEQVSTGLPHILVPLRNLQFLKKAKVEKDLYYQIIEKTWAKNILVFCLEGYTEGHDISVRMFADCLGIPEDPATGSGNGCLAGYLVKHRVFGSDEIDVKAAQGYEIKRPSLLLLRAHQHGDDIHISVGGKVTLVAEGNWL